MTRRVLFILIVSVTAIGLGFWFDHPQGWTHWMTAGQPGWVSAGPAGPLPGYPKPRYPAVPQVNSVDDLVPNAKVIVTRNMPYSGNQFPGWEIKEGETVLFVVSSSLDPWVVDAFVQAMRDLNCRVDLLVQGAGIGRGQVNPDDWAPSSMRRKLEWPEQKKREDQAPLFSDAQWLMDLAQKRGYDKVVGATYRSPETEADIGYGLDWVTREMLASPAVTYPYEIVYEVDKKTWEKVRQAQEVHITDPEGSDYRFTWFDEYWQVVEGSHPKIKVSGSGSHVYGPGRSEVPLISSHLMGYPQGIVLERSNAEGVVAGCHSTEGLFPHIKVFLKNNAIERVEGGGDYGRLWGDYLVATSKITYPTYPGPGSKFLIETALGTHPKVAVPHNVFESRIARRGWSYQRNRTGIFHVGLGQHLATAWAEHRGLVGGHNHINMWFSTYRIKMKNGQEALTVDKGRLTALDDPEVRQVASRFGNPDELLQEAWIPEVPGINAEGDYLKDYAQNPAAWQQKAHRRAYGSLLDKKLYP
ncbi:MAG: hypothetical protein HY652_07535 [Acidobacteria bacterium]|nr:hypothetical protein [Acidobacteriota bacterium]